MRKTAIGSILLTTMLIAQLSGCGAGDQEASGVPDAARGAEVSSASDGAQGTDVSGAASATGRKLSEGEGSMLDPFAVQALEGKDNSLDAYSVMARFSLQTENPENAQEGGLSASFLGASKAYCFKKHLF